MSCSFLAACATTPSSVEPLMPAPLAEVAPAPRPAAAMPAPAADAPRDAAARVYHRTARVEHSWFAPGVGRMQVAFELGCSAPAAAAALADAETCANWDAACAAARAVCERADLTTDAGLAACEAALCERLTRTLFGDSVPDARVERVAWKRVLWR